MTKGIRGVIEKCQLSRLFKQWTWNLVVEKQRMKLDEDCLLPGMSNKNLPSSFLLPKKTSSVTPWVCKKSVQSMETLFIAMLPLCRKALYFFDHATRFVFLCVCLSLCLSSGLWRDGCTQQYGITWGFSLDNSSTLQHYQDDPPADPDHMDHLYKITFWPITSKLMNGFTPNFTCI